MYTSECVSVAFLQGRLQESDVQKPTAVQEAAIPTIMSGRNVAMQCYTGSGKVCAPIGFSANLYLYKFVTAPTHFPDTRHTSLHAMTMDPVTCTKNHLTRFSTLHADAGLPTPSPQQSHSER